VWKSSPVCLGNAGLQCCINASLALLDTLLGGIQVCTGLGQTVTNILGKVKITSLIDEVETCRVACKSTSAAVVAQA